MNVLFIQKMFVEGGVSIFSAVLANKFLSEGHHVSIFAFGDADGEKESILSPDVHTYSGIGHEWFRWPNVTSLRSVVLAEAPDLIINNWGLPWKFITTIRLALVGVRNKPVVWSMYHNDPIANSKIIRFEQKSAQNHGIAHVFTRLITRCIKILSALSFRYVYRLSDGYILLCESYVKEFCEFTGLRYSPKMWSQINPLTMQTGDFVLEPSAKQKELLYVGRLDPYSKKVNRLLNVWRLLEKQYPDWRFTIVGDGPDKENLLRLTKSYELNRISFEGRRRPDEYYKRASILCLCSDFEGFPLVIGEAMSLGCIPVVYDSFAAVYDMINDGIDGLIVPKRKNGFSAETMVETLVEIMNNTDKRYRMMAAARKKSELFAIDIIYSQWKQRIKQANITGKHSSV